MKLKDTIYTPQTDFSMRANAAVKEIDFLKQWQQQKIYEKILLKNKHSAPYYLHHGPPYANGDIHIGHCLNVILKEFTQRIKLQNSFYAPMMFGWDTHGLPIEHALLKRHKNYEELSVTDFRQKCREYALSQIDLQTKAFERLGLIIDFRKNYITMNKEYEATQIDILYQLLLKNYIYRAKKPIIWSWSSRSALAEAEVEYKNITSPSIFVLAKIITDKKALLNTFLLIWTTTPWTLPSNKAIAFNNQFTYVIAETKSAKKIILSQDAYDSLKDKLQLKFFRKLKITELEGLKYKSPTTKETCQVVQGHHLDAKQGTGLVHIAPGHGKDDYLIGIKNNLQIQSGVNEKGIMTDKKYQGIFYTKADALIIKDLMTDKLLLFQDTINHSYPTDWRTGKPVIFRATTQWFINVNIIKTKLIEHIKNVVWVQPWAKKRMISMIENRDDWCISRQRKWGVPIAIFYDEANQPIIDKILFKAIYDAFYKYGSDIYYTKQFEKIISKNNSYLQTLLTKVKSKEHDIMDVWLDSGISHYAVMYKQFKQKKSDLYLEGTDQFRGWFNSSLITSVMLNDDAPYDKVITHGFIVDKEGKKMSKSKGNGIPVKKIIAKYGADILRLFFANCDYNEDVRISDDILAQTAKQYRKIRNVFRFLLANLNDYQNLKVADFTKIDLYILERLNHLIKSMQQHCDHFNYKGALKEFNNFIIIDLSSLYLEISKDILYIKEPTATRKQQIKNVFFILLEKLTLLIAPFLPFLAEDVYQHSPFKNKEIVSIHLFGNAKKVALPKNTEVIKKNMKILLKLKTNLNHVIDEAIKANKCKKISEIECVIQEGTLSNFFTKKEIKEVLQTAKVTIVPEIKTNLATTDDVAFHYVINKNLVKCDRCWSYFLNITNIQRKENLYHICLSCKKILDKHFPSWE